MHHFHSAMLCNGINDSEEKNSPQRSFQNLVAKGDNYFSEECWGKAPVQNWLFLEESEWGKYRENSCW